MQRKRDELVPIGEVVADLDGPVKAIREASPQALHHFTRFDQVNQLVGASEADGPARDAAGSAGEPQGAGDGEAPGAGRVSPGRATARARDREPGGPGERPGGGVEPEQAETFEVGRGVRAGAGGNPVPAAGEEQCEAGGKGNGCRIESRARQGGSARPGAGAPPGPATRVNWRAAGPSHPDLLRVLR